MMPVASGLAGKLRLLIAETPAARIQIDMIPMTE
jgi:hypothetical protein